DLFYRLNVIPFRVPALRERPSDIPMLAKSFMDAFARESGSRQKALTPAALAKLQTLEWPGNVRQLRNFVERLFILTPADLIDVEDLRASGGDLGDDFDSVILPGKGDFQGRTLREARAE